MSGLNQRFTKPSFPNRNREFESRSLRHDLRRTDLRLSEQASSREKQEMRKTERMLSEHTKPRVGIEKFYEQRRVKYS